MHAAERAEGRAARVPGDLDLLVAASLSRAAARLLDALDDDPECAVDALLQRLDLDQERRFDVRGQDAGRHVVEGAQHPLVDELAGHQPRHLEHHALGARAGLLEDLEARNDDRQALGQREQAHQRAGDDRERALAAGHERAQVAGVGVLEPGDGAVAEHDLERRARGRP